ncbi:MDR family MFS transporter [Lactobacillus sp. Sy-1]|uniref:MDR family MFS transporter n=1 Tax=Lactobacillus sp. Sy-1 TaxID=2109645 RepID=UPI001C55E709|nr:MDR family MFS transporter [Lactobacillus sp. Sy-1]MBW1605039.1 multidrug efflux MFS transporter [Lactobacillus sp. Sy-1]
MNKVNKEAKSSGTGIISAILLIGTFACVLSQMLLTTALPKLMTAFDINTSTVQWLTTGFLMVNGIMIPISGFLGRRINTKWLFIGAMTVFLIGCIISYVAPNFATLFIGRIVQAFGTGIMMPLLQTIMFSLFPPEKRGAALGLVGIVVGVAPAIGPTLSGWIVDSFNWRDLFGMEIPIIIAVIILGLIFMRPVLPTTKEKIDLVSILLSTVGFGGLLYGFSSVGNDGWGSAKVISSLVIGAIVVAIFVWRELKIKKPFLEMRVFKYTRFTLGTILSTIMMIAMFGVETILPIYLQNVHGLSALDSGLTLLVGALMMALMSPITGKAFDKFGARRLAMVGVLLLTVGTIPFMYLNATTPVMFIVSFYTLRMIGIAMVLMPVTTYGMNALPNDLISDGTAANNTVRQIGGSIGSAIIVSILSNVTSNAKPAHHLLTENPIAYKVQAISAVIDGYHAAFLFAAVFCVLGLIVTFFLTDKKKTK